MNNYIKTTVAIHLLLQVPVLLVMTHALMPLQSCLPAPAFLCCATVAASLWVIEGYMIAKLPELD